MSPIVKIIGTIVLILAVMAYTVFNFINGRTDASMFAVSMVLLVYVLIGMVRQLILQLKNR